MSLLISLKRCVGLSTRRANRFLSATKLHEFEAAAHLMDTNKENSFQVNFDNDWSIGDALNGGYLMSVALKAAGKCIPNLDPLSFTGYYMNKGLENTVATVDVNILSKSKSSATVEVSITQLGLLRTRYMGVFGNLKNGFSEGLSHNKLVAPVLPPIEQCIDGSEILRAAAGTTLALSHRMEFRLDGNSAYANGVLKSQQTEEASLDCYVAFADGFTPDLRSLSHFSDSFPPCVLNLTSFGWVPTLQYNVHFWAKPPVYDTSNNTEEQNKKLGFFQNKQWLRAHFHSDHVVNSMLYTDGELWSADGETLLATSRQMARVFTPRK